MEKATDIILVICGTLLCVGGMFSVGNTFRSVLGIGLGLLLVVLGLVDKNSYVTPIPISWNRC